MLGRGVSVVVFVFGSRGRDVIGRVVERLERGFKGWVLDWE